MNLKVMPSSGPVGNMEVTQQHKAPKVKVTPEREPPPEDKRPSPSELEREKLRRALKAATKNTRFSYSFHEAMETVVVKIIDGNTDKVIKEIPAREIQQLHENLHEAIGILFDQQI